MFGEILINKYSQDNIENNKCSNFYDKYEEISDNNNGSTNNTGNDTNENGSGNNIDLRNSKTVQKNFIKKKDAEKINSPLVRKTFKETEEYCIEALKFSKACDHYYTETLVKEFWIEDTQKSFIKKSNNYISKRQICKYSKSESNRSFTLYYKIRVDNTVYYTYYDQYYRQYKTSELCFSNA